MKFDANNYRYPSRRGLVYATRGMAATSHPLAAQAGLEAMDVITAVNGTEISGYNDLVAALSSGKEGEKVALTVERDGETIELTVTLGVRRESAI